MRALVGALCVCGAATAAPVPPLVPHEGRLLRANGAPERGVVRMTFALYTAAEGGDPVWRESRTVVIANDGYYAVLLGEVAPLPSFDAPYWLGVTVEGEAEMAPRARLGSAPFALRAAQADDAARLGGVAATDVLAKLQVGGAAAAIVSAITVTARADCGDIPPAPRMEVYINGGFVGALDVTNSSFADSPPFTVSPARYAHEIAVAFVNDNQNGGCDHNLYVDRLTLTTAAGNVIVRADDAAHVIYDLYPFFDGVHVIPGQATMAWAGALRFFIAPAAVPPPTSTR